MPGLMAGAWQELNLRAQLSWSRAGASPILALLA